MTAEGWLPPVDDAGSFVRLQLNFNDAWTEWDFGCNGWDGCVGDSCWFHCDHCAAYFMHIRCIRTTRSEWYSVYTGSQTSLQIFGPLWMSVDVTGVKGTRKLDFENELIISIIENAKICNIYFKLYSRSKFIGHVYRMVVYKEWGYMIVATGTNSSTSTQKVGTTSYETPSCIWHFFLVFLHHFISLAMDAGLRVTLELTRNWIEQNFIYVHCTLYTHRMRMEIWR